MLGTCKLLYFIFGKRFEQLVHVAQDSTQLLFEIVRDFGIYLFFFQL